MDHSWLMTDYDNVKLPVFFKKKFTDLNDRFELGYTSFPELVRELLRNWFKEIEGETESPIS